MPDESYGFGLTTTLEPSDAESRIRAALADEGFGILTEIDVSATLKTKLDVDLAPYTILGACNPQLAHKALQLEQNIGLLLPCNVVVYETEGGSAIEILNPNLMSDLTGNPDMETVASEARERLQRALAAVDAG